MVECACCECEGSQHLPLAVNLQSNSFRCKNPSPVSGGIHIAYKSNVNAQIRGFYFAGSGKDTNSGETLEVPFATMQAAIDAAFALEPIPQNGNVALVNVAQGGSFDVGFVLQDWIQFNAEDVTIEASQAIVVDIASFLSLRIAGVTNLQNGGVTFMIDGRQAIGLEALFMAIAGTSAIGLKILGVVDDLFITISRILIVGEGSTGIDITSATTDPIDININTVSMSADNSIFMNYNPVNTTDRCAVDVSTISENGFTTTAFIIDSGILVVEAAIVATTTFAVLNNDAQFTIRSQAIQGTLVLNDTSVCIVKPVAFYVGNIDINDTATLFMDAQVLFGNIDMEVATNGLVDVGLMQGNVINNGTLFLEIESLIGDITVAAGATLNCDIASHTGSLTNNGTINGLINGVPFGNYRQKAIEEVVLNAQDFTTQSPTGTDAPLQVTFGGAQLGPSDPVQIDDLGNIQINQADQYMINLLLQYGRSGAGSFVLLFFRVLIDGVQLGASRYAKLDTSNTNLPVQFSAPINLTSGQIITVEFIRDSTGFDAGDLVPETPALAGLNSSPSASIGFTRSRNVQPVEEGSPPITDGLVGLYNELGIVGATTVTAWLNSVSGLPDLDVVNGIAANLTRVTALGFPSVNASGSVSIETTAGSTVSSPATVFLVSKFNNATPGVNQNLIDARTSLTDRMMFQSRQVTTDRFTLFQSTNLITLSGAYDTSPHIWTGQFNGDSTTTLTVEGVGTITGDAGSGGWDFGTLFGSTIGTETAEATITTLLVYDRALSLSERSEVITFLTDKYGL